jgi:hypothetical protein
VTRTILAGYGFIARRYKKGTRSKDLGFFLFGLSPKRNKKKTLGALCVSAVNINK